MQNKEVNKDVVSAGGRLAHRVIPQGTLEHELCCRIDPP